MENGGTETCFNQAFVSWRGQTRSASGCKGSRRADFCGMLTLWFQLKLRAVIQNILKTLSFLKDHKLFFDPIADVSSLLSFIYFNFFPQPGKIDPLTSCCSSRQSSRTLRLRRPSRPVSDHLGIWHKVYLPRAPALGSKDYCNMLFTVRTGREKKAEYRSLVFWGLVLYLRSQELLPKLLASWQILFSNIH